MPLLGEPLLGAPAWRAAAWCIPLWARVLLLRILFWARSCSLRVRFVLNIEKILLGAGGMTEVSLRVACLVLKS